MNHWLPLSAGALAWACQRWLVPRLPEPTLSTVPTDDGLAGKLPYAQLGTVRHQATAAAAAVAAGLVATTLPSWSWPVLLVLAGPVTSLVNVDMATTWLPRDFTRVCWWLCGVAVLAGALLAGTPQVAVRWVLGAVAAGAFFWFVWRMGNAIGFGDVRLAPMIGLAAATRSWQDWLMTMLLASLVGVLWGVVTQLWRSRAPHPLGAAYPYGPALWLGLWLALLLG